MPAKKAADLLMTLPMEKQLPVAAALRPDELAAVLIPMLPDARQRILNALPAAELPVLIGRIPLDRAAELLPMVPPERLAPLVAALPDETLLDLLRRLPADARQNVWATTPPDRGRSIVSLAYERDVSAALRRNNADVAVPPGAPRGILVATIIGQHIAVATVVGDDGRAAVRDAKEAAYRLKTAGALAVIDQAPADDVAQHCRMSEWVDVVSWSGAHDDHVLKRSVVSLLS